ncbi:DUF7716 domain-containing protein [Corallococcus exiguus]|uniref:DUF7716 domain-containing protein n=1 Tax=Corallococcus exiguus TaxID=83462 RepID=UPI00155FB063|nr:hypothetical protein [Corallococcus exiguus]NRD49791.1 hypothetical protein [Corallococcus exiguus]
MSAEKFESLGQVLLAVDEDRTYGFALYMRDGPPWLESTECMFLERDVYSGDLPEAAANNGLRYILSGSHVFQVVNNARLQRPDVGVSGLVEALSFYFRNDAFILF